MAAPLAVGRANLGRLKWLQQLYLDASLVDRTLDPAGPDRAGRPAAAAAPALVCVGRHDPQTPWPDNAAIAAALQDGRLEVFERSGHYPFLEEPDRFTAVVAGFLSSVTR